MDVVPIGIQMSNDRFWGDYRHVPNEISFTHQLWYSANAIDPPVKGAGTSDFFELMNRRENIYDRAMQHCAELGLSTFPTKSSCLVFPAQFDYKIDISSYFVYLGFQDKTKAMAFKLGFTL